MFDPPDPPPLYGLEHGPVGQSLLASLSARWIQEDHEIRTTFQADRERESARRKQKIQELEVESQQCLAQIESREVALFRVLVERRQKILQDTTQAPLISWWDWWNSFRQSSCDDPVSSSVQRN